MVGMDTEKDWYRQLLALVLLSASKAAVDFITKPGSREAATDQLRNAFQEIDYDAVARAVTRAIDDVAASSKDRLGGTIDTLRDKSVDAVEEVKDRAERQLGGRRRGGKMRLVFTLALGGLIAYFLMDEQRRDDLLDRLTGASGPIQQMTSTTSQQAASATQDTTQEAADAASQPADEAKTEVQS